MCDIGHAIVSVINQFCDFDILWSISGPRAADTELGGLQNGAVLAKTQLYKHTLDFKIKAG